MKKPDSSTSTPEGFIEPDEWKMGTLTLTGYYSESGYDQEGLRLFHVMQDIEGESFYAELCVHRSVIENVRTPNDIELHKIYKDVQASMDDSIEDDTDD